MYCDWPQLGRCCFCLPLRRGVLTFGYINLLLTLFLLVVESYFVHFGLRGHLYHGTTISLSSELSVAVYCVEIIFNGVLIFGTHKRSVPHIRAFYYFAIATTIVPLLFSIIECVNSSYFASAIEIVLITLISFFVNVYLIALVRSLLRKLEMEGPHLYDNKLHQIVTGEIKGEPNEIYNNTTVGPADV